MGSLGIFLYGFLFCLIGVVGLYYIIYLFFWYMFLGGIESVVGVIVFGV